MGVLDDYVAEAFITRKVTIVFKDKLLAGLPARGDALDFWIAQKHMSEEDAKVFKTRIAAGLLTDDEREEITNTSRCIFERDAQGKLVVWHGNVKAMLREVFTTIGLTQKAPGREKSNPSAGGKQVVQHMVHVSPLHIPVCRNGEQLSQPDGLFPKVKHIEDKAGRRSALGEYEYVLHGEMTFTVRWPAGWKKERDGSIFTEDEIKRVFACAQLDGLGASRSQGHGTFEVTKWEVA